ncbi:unnamed protein product [Pleuronectes platessa]|uniref:Uncharacterized protein n=1 Tax=Pleuronectes platessa TaxID=8262 RepID=A0A9N7TK25_PLEPL|nr:unnamed protein product [Pleuronectes platessa]
MEKEKGENSGPSLLPTISKALFLRLYYHRWKRIRSPTRSGIILATPLHRTLLYSPKNRYQAEIKGSSPCELPSDPTHTYQ